MEYIADQIRINQDWPGNKKKDGGGNSGAPAAPSVFTAENIHKVFVGVPTAERWKLIYELLWIVEGWHKTPQGADYWVGVATSALRASEEAH